MASIKMISNKNQSNGGMKFLLAYATDRKKTEMENGRILVSGINCSPSFAYNEFLLTKSEYHKTDGRMYYDVNWTQSRKYICYTTPQGNKHRGLFRHRTRK